MEINGRTIKWNCSQSSRDRTHVPVIQSSVRKVLASMKYIESYHIMMSEGSDSLYFRIKFKGVIERYVLSLRSHSVKKAEANYIYINVPDYEDLDALNNEVKRRVEQVHEGIVTMRTEVSKTHQKRYKQTNIKKRKYNPKNGKVPTVMQSNYTTAKYAVARSCNAAFEALMLEVNGEQQKQEEIYS